MKFDNIKKIYIAGGEPLIMKELYQFLDQCATENHTDIEIIINTNGTKLSEKFTNVIGRFTNLQFIFSIDGAKEMNNYIRWGSDWKTIIKNWHYLRNHNHKVMVNTTVSIYNIHRLHEICDFIDKHFPNTLLHLQTLQTPQYLSPFLFPNPNLVLDSLNLVQKSQCYKNDPLLTSTIDGYVRWFASGKKYQNSSLGEFFKFNDLLDQSRAVRLADYDAVLDSFRNTC